MQVVFVSKSLLNIKTVNIITLAKSPKFPNFSIVFYLKIEDNVTWNI